MSPTSGTCMRGRRLHLRRRPVLPTRTIGYGGRRQRRLSPLLLQVMTTNPVESWHSVLKNKDITKSIPVILLDWTGLDLRVGSSPVQKVEGRPPVCICLFFQKWQLPCRHIWQHHVLFGSLTATMMETWVWMWEDGGYEHYEGRGTD
jgi:hypothetical protein